MTGNKNALVSVIIPTFNRGSCLGRALTSVLAQTYKNLEVIVIDNHSTDNTDEFLASFDDPRIRSFKMHNQGVIAASRNAGICEAKGKWIAFLDSDDWWLPEKIATSVVALEGGVDLVYHDLYVFNEKKPNENKLKKLKTRKLSEPIFDDLFQKGNGIINSSVVVRKSVLDKIGIISEDRDLIAAEDYDTWLRISKITNRFKQLNGCYGWYTIGCDNISNSERSVRNIKRILEKHDDRQSEGYPLWAEYALSRAYFKLNIFKKAKKHSLRSMQQVSSPLLLIKSCVTYFGALWLLAFSKKGDS